MGERMGKDKLVEMYVNGGQKSGWMGEWTEWLMDRQVGQKHE